MSVQLYKYNGDEYHFAEGLEKHICLQFEPLKEPKFTFWLNFHSLNEKEEIIQLSDRFGIDKLLQEDIFQGSKRSRLEEYSEYIFFTIISALPSNDPAHYDLNKDRLSFVVGDNFLVSFQEKSSQHFTSVRERIELKRGKIRFKGPDFLLFRLLEAIIDNYFEVTAESAETIETLDKLVLRNPKSEILRKIEWEKRKLIELRKVVVPIKELLMQLDRVENKLIVEENNHYFKELRDNCLSITEEIEAQKSILDGISNLYYAIQGQRLNEVMKVLTVISAVFIPLTFIVGVYGMNFTHMPELNWRYGYFLILGGMFILAISLIFIFWKRGWLKRND